MPNRDNHRPVPGETGKIATTTLKGKTTGVNHQIKFEPAVAPVLSELGIHEAAKGGNECPFDASTVKVNGGAAKYIDTVGANMTGEPETTVGATTFT